jgi:predicted CxxxxCH...CXXCH cytochrome family protein
MATGSHQKHLSYAFTTTSDTVKCMICHKYTDYPFVTSCFGNPYGNIICHASGTSAKHANGKIDVRIDPVFGSMSAYNGSPEPGNGYSNCTNTYCHSNGTSVSTGVITPNSTTNWGSGTMACNSCHGSPPAYANGQPKANSHSKHASFNCNRCHYGTTTTGTTITSAVLHVNKAFNVSGPPETPFTYTYAATGGSCTSNSCHSDGTSVSTGIAVYAEAAWGSSSGCSACHGAPPAYVNGTPKVNSHARHGYMSCSKCHWPTTQTGDSITGTTAHLNNQYDIGNSSGSLVYSYNAAGGSCSGTFGCHQPVSWGGSVQGSFSDCLSCHKSPMGGARQVVDSNGDGTGTGGDFKQASHHVLNYKTIAESGAPAFSPSATVDGIPAGFVSAANAYASDASYATSAVNGNTQIYQDYHIALPGISQVITKVEVGVQGFYTAAVATTSRLYIQVSWDNGVTWSNEQSVLLPRNSATTSYLNFFTSTAWSADKLNDTNFRARVRNVPGTGATNYLDWLPVRVTYSSYNISHSITNADCLVCHEVSQHPGGAVRLKDADTGAIYVYNPASPASAENFCLSCHDTNGANGNMAPFSDGKSLGVAPYKAGTGIRTSWAKTFGHKQQGLTCLGNGNPNTGCHSNGHGAENVGMLSKSMALPLLSDSWYSAADEGSFQACFSCHQSYPRVAKEAILGYRLGGNYDINGGDGPPPYSIPDIMTKFRDRNSQGSGKPYDDPAFFTGMSNLHYFHLQGGAYDYREMYSSSITCISCHNVHGSNTQWGAVYDEMQYGHFDGTGGDKYGRIGAGASLGNFPTSCTFNCHDSYMGTTSNWFEPAGE